MAHLFIDTNIVLDLLSKREKFYRDAQDLFTLADNNNETLYISTLTFANTYYLLSKHHKPQEAKNILLKFKLLVTILSVNDKILELALISDFKDFEDAIQYFTALENKTEFIITRNKKDFKHTQLPVMTAKEYLKSLAL
ncbi:MAG: PIN domain-containing protein [Flavobacteriaceae bacterium]